MAVSSNQFNFVYNGIIAGAILPGTTLSIVGCTINIGAAAGTPMYSAVLCGLVGYVLDNNLQVYDTKLVNFNVYTSTTNPSSFSVIGTSYNSVINMTKLTVNSSFYGNYYGCFNYSTKTNLTLNYTILNHTAITTTTSNFSAIYMQINTCNVTFKNITVNYT